MDGQLSCYKFEYVWRNISLDSLLTDEEIDNSVEVNSDGQFETEREPEEFVVETVEEDEDNDNADDDDDNESKKDEEQNDYYDDKDPAPALEEEDDNEIGNDNDNDSVDDETINEDDNTDEVEQEKWYYKEKFMLDWINRFAQTHCVHPGFAISIDEMMELFKGQSNMTHRMK